MSATARSAITQPSAVRPRAAKPANSSRSSRTPLVVVAPLAPRHGRSAFVAVMAGVLAVGLAALLALNTMLAQDAFTLHTLQQQQATLAVTEQSVAALLAKQEDPGRLAMRARALGMRHGGAPLFLRLPDGAVLGARPGGTNR